ncbi:MAG: sulfatase [Planctomycetes bacterium]|nr:sulfatase [Planctomycetota bacterium]
MTRLRQALATGLVLGSLWGALEALLGVLVPALRFAAETGSAAPLDWLDVPAVAALGALRYALAGVVIVVPLTLLLGPWLGRSERARDMLPARVFVAFVVAVNHYWFTKPLWPSSWGYPFHHPVRLAQTAAWVLLGALVAWAVVRPRRAVEAEPAGAGVTLLRRVLIFAVGFVDLGWAATGDAGLHLLGGRSADAVGFFGVAHEGALSGMPLPYALGVCALFALMAALVLGDRALGVRRPGALTTTLVLLLLAGGATWASLREERLGEPPPAAFDGERPPNVLLIVADALRADHVGCYGNEREPPVSPHVDALAADGVQLDRTWAQAPFTWTSFGSMLTGKYPRRHGLIKMSPTQRLDPQANRTLAQALSDQGYATGAFLTGTLSNESGLLQGFGTYFETIVGHEPVNRASKWSIVRSGMLLAILFNKVRQALDPALVNTEAMRWIGDHADRPFFALVHYYSTHTPYDPPAPYDALYGLDAYDGPYAPFLQSHAVVIMKALRDGHCWVPGCDKPLWTCGHFDPARDVPAIHALYDAGLKFADDMVGDLLALLDEKGIADDTLVIFTADHGEELFDHAIFEHDWMFETNLHIPVVMRLPGRLPAGARVSWPTEEIDLAPTILDLVGRGALPDADGRSLLPDVSGVEPPSDELWTFAENVRYVSMRGPRYKLTRNRFSGELRVFDLLTDPHEAMPLDLSRLANAALRDDLLARLDRYDASMPAVTRLKTFAADPHLAERLNALGYVGWHHDTASPDAGATDASAGEGAAAAKSALDEAWMLGSNEMLEEDLYGRAFVWTPDDQARVLRRP